jgi:hypothetical protein
LSSNYDIDYVDGLLTITPVAIAPPALTPPLSMPMASVLANETGIMPFSLSPQVSGPEGGEVLFMVQDPRLAHTVCLAGTAFTITCSAN